MRWKDPEFGACRVVKRFLFLPLHLGKETRWLEWAKITQVYLVCLGWCDHAWSEEDWP